MIDGNGKQIGITSREFAIEKAKELGVDLVEIAPNANPPVCKLIDFKKFRYLEQRKEREAKKHTKEAEIKEIRFGPFVSDHDLDIRIKKIEEFFKKGYRVKVTIKFTGRQMSHTEFGQTLIEKIKDYFADRIKIEREAKFEGRRYSIIFAPKSTKNGKS